MELVPWPCKLARISDFNIPPPEQVAFILPYEFVVKMKSTVVALVALKSAVIVSAAARPRGVGPECTIFPPSSSTGIGIQSL